MRSSRLVPCLLLVLDVSPSSAAPAHPRSEAEERELDANEDGATAATAQPDDGAPVRVLSQLGFGIGTLALTSGLGAGIVALACDARFQDCSFPIAAGAVVGAYGGYLLYPLAVTGGGALAGGRGHAGGAYLGALAGVAVYAGLGALGAASGEPSLAVVLGVLGLGSMLAGPIVGYELTHAAGRPKPEPGFFTWVPAFGIAPDGRIHAALGGRF